MVLFQISSFYPHLLLCYFLMPFISLHTTCIITGAHLLIAPVAVLCNCSCFSIWTILLSFCFCLLYFPSSTFYMLFHWICGSFFLFALFHFLCRAVVRSAEVPSLQPRGPVRHVEVVDSCLRPLQRPGLMLPTPL